MAREDALKVAIVGATGAVGRVLLAQLAQRAFPVRELVLFASGRSRGKRIQWQGREYIVQTLEAGCFEGVDVAFFDASDAVSREWVPRAAESGAWVIDNSGAFRMAEDIELVVPEVNGEQLVRRLRTGDAARGRSRILAGPNCSTVQLVMALKPLQDRWGLERVVVSSYQSTSGAGLLAMDELRDQARATLAGEAQPAPRWFAKRVAWNCIPQIGAFDADGVTSEERKIQEESRKILGLPGLRIAATAVRVPTLACHAESVSVELERDFDLQEVRKALAGFAGVRVVDDCARGEFPTGLECHGKDEVFVGRIRRDPSCERGLNLWIVSDNLVKGAALNAIQTAETLLAALE